MFDEPLQAAERVACEGNRTNRLDHKERDSRISESPIDLAQEIATAEVW
jgi:hypothetical protein